MYLHIILTLYISVHVFLYKGFPHASHLTSQILSLSHKLPPLQSRSQFPLWGSDWKKPCLTTICPYTLSSRASALIGLTNPAVLLCSQSTSKSRSRFETSNPPSVRSAHHLKGCPRSKNMGWLTLASCHIWILPMYPWQGVSDLAGLWRHVLLAPNWPKIQKSPTKTRTVFQEILQWCACCHWPHLDQRVSALDMVKPYRKKHSNLEEWKAACFFIGILLKEVPLVVTVKFKMKLTHRWGYKAIS